MNDSETIEVGRIRNDSADVFIAVPLRFYEPITSGLRQRKMASIRIPVADVRWLIEALKRELPPSDEEIDYYRWRTP